MRGGESPRLRYPGGARRVLFLARPNRYLALVRTSAGEELEAHVPNPGRLRELLPPGGTEGHIVPAGERSLRRGVRRTRWTLVNVAYPPRPSTLVSVDTGAARPLVEQALQSGAVPEVRGWGRWRPEVVWGTHRFDHGVVGTAEGRRGPVVQALFETKSSNLREGDCALFPDAPSVRGASHVRALTRFVRSGRRAAVLFLVQRDDVREVRPYGAMDPEFARAVQRARQAGVLFLGRTVHVRPDGADWGEALPVRSPRWEPGKDLDVRAHAGREREGPIGRPGVGPPSGPTGRRAPTGGRAGTPCTESLPAGAR